MLMSEIKITTDGGRRWSWSAAEKLRIMEETLYYGEGISAVARRDGVAPNLLYRWCKLMLEGGSIAGTGNDSVIPSPGRWFARRIGREGATKPFERWKPASGSLNASWVTKRWRWRS